MKDQRMAVILADIIVKLTELHGILMSPDEPEQSPRAAWKAATEAVQRDEETAMLRKVHSLDTPESVIAYMQGAHETLNAMTVPRANRIRDVARTRVLRLRKHPVPAHGEEDQRPHHEIHDEHDERGE